MKKLLILFTLFVFTGLFAACATKGAVKTADAPVPVQASAVLKPAQDGVVQGSILFKEEEGGVRLIAEVSGLTPGWHGFHIHETGDCSAPDFSSAGGHFNPQQVDHGKVGEGHAGDLPSLEADADGNAKLDELLTCITLTGEHSIVGRALIVHANPDDYAAQPTGNAGPRVACAVIE
ncbi:MAG: superoxide dismutase family protein [Cystobacterineae bacterium]|nr:superoxide dismutase family protein [Cystobacterineae bacterium]